ncbi:hypothetical protein EI613_12095 [Azospirillum sp. 412522]|nr:hypothetical protein [Azospirillum sp. 412522]MBY6262647.1 hypothetical protein [Azospirillum sp. 412522]
MLIEIQSFIGGAACGTDAQQGQRSVTPPKIAWRKRRTLISYTAVTGGRPDDALIGVWNAIAVTDSYATSRRERRKVEMPRALEMFISSSAARRAQPEERRQPASIAAAIGTAVKRNDLAGYIREIFAVNAVLSIAARNHFKALQHQAR